MRAHLLADRPPPPVAAPDYDLDTYAVGGPSSQAALDIFRHGWSSQFPASLGLTAGAAALFDDTRIRWLIDKLGGVSGMNVLELGPLEGGHSYMLERAGAKSVLAVEACVLSYLKCLVAKEVTGMARVKFEFGDFMQHLAASSELYDLIVASGVLYHQSEPLECIERMARRSDAVFLWTHYYADDISSEKLRASMFARSGPRSVGGYSCEHFKLRYDDYLAHVKYRGGVADHSHWLRREDILGALRHFGFDDITVAFDEQRHLYGPNIALLARRYDPTTRPARPVSYEEQMRAMAGPEPWCVDSMVLDADQLTVAGWAIPPGGDPVRVDFRVDGASVTEVDMGRSREDVGWFYFYYPGSNRSGFSLRVPVSAQDHGKKVVSLYDRATGTPVERLHDVTADLRVLREPGPLPPLANIQRAHAGNTPVQYLVEGCSIAEIAGAMAAEHGGKTFAACRAILDFGCGPARLTRHVTRMTQARVVGVDVDTDTIAWCRANVPGAEFHAAPLHPPLDLAAESFDCIIAIDVLTHLRPADGLAWLKELRRVAAPEALFLVSIAADRALTRARLSARHYESVKTYDVMVLSRNPDLDGVVSEPDYYQNTFHSHAYVRQHWPACGFDVMSIVPGCIGNHYDMVVMRCSRNSGGDVYGPGAVGLVPIDALLDTGRT